MKNKNETSQRQFRNGSAPIQPADYENRAYRQEPSSPSAQRRRNSVAVGFQEQARPGLAGKQDYSRKKRGR